MYDVSHSLQSLIHLRSRFRNPALCAVDDVGQQLAPPPDAVGVRTFFKLDPAFFQEPAHVIEQLILLDCLHSCLCGFLGQSAQLPQTVQVLNAL